MNSSTNITDHDAEILNRFIQVAPFFQKVFPIDNMVGICDTAKYLALYPGQIVKPPFDAVGTPIPSGDPLDLAIQTGRVSSTTMPKEIFGFPFKSIAIPIKNGQGKIIGALGLGISTETQNILDDAAQTFSATSEEITATTEELTANALELAKTLADVKELSQVVTEQIKKTDGILKFINDVSTNSKLLGLNAAIEAARAGEQGRGFSIVADEIRKMATNSSSSVKDIKELLTIIRDRSDQMIIQINHSTDLAKNQATASEGIANAMSELAASAEDIQKVAQII